MVGPFMQGFLLLGIIYWYTKGMMSMINDYYRSEFQQKLKAENAKNVTHYDLENLEQLIQVEAESKVEEYDSDINSFDWDSMLPTDVEMLPDIGAKLNASCRNPRNIQLIKFLLYERWQSENQQICWISQEQQQIYKAVK